MQETRIQSLVWEDALEEEMATHSCILPGKSHGQRSLAGYSSLDHKELDIHIEDDFGTFAGGHAGPNDHNDPEWQENVIISRDVRFAKTHWKYAGAPFAWYRFSPGMKTVAGLYEENGKYKLITFLAESLSEKDAPQSDKKHLLATYSHGIFKPVVPVKELWEQVLRIGATQHYAIVDGDWRKELEDFAEIMGFEFYSIK